MDVIHQAANDLESDGTHHGGLRAIGNGLRGGNAQPLAFAKRLLHIITGLRLDAHQVALRCFSAGRQGAAAEQSTATQADEKTVEFTHLFKQFQGSSTLTTEHVGMVKGRYEGHAMLCGQALRNGHRIFAVAVITHHVGPIATGSGEFGGRGIVRHHNGGGYRQNLRRQRNRLRVITRRIGHHPDLPLCGGKARQGIEAPPEFESAHALEVFTFEKYLQSQAIIQTARLQHRCAVGVALQTLGG